MPTARAQHGAVVLNDQIYVIGTPRALDAFERTCGERVVWKRRVVVFGAGTGHPYFSTDTVAAPMICPTIA